MKLALSCLNIKFLHERKKLFHYLNDFICKLLNGLKNDFKLCVTFIFINFWYGDCKKNCGCNY